MNDLPTIVLSQLSAPFFNIIDRLNMGNIPLAAGYLKSIAYTEGLLQHFDIVILDAETSNLGGDALIVDKILSYHPIIVGFSLYVWNSLRSLRIIKEIKQRSPRTKIFVGGPEVSLESSYILNNKFIDVGFFSEGEHKFCNVLKHYTFGNPELKTIGGIFYKENGDLTINKLDFKLIDRLDEIPSPYLLGFLRPKEYNAIWLELSRGCRYRCKYCSERSRVPKYFSAERTEKEIELAIRERVKRVFFWDSNLLASPIFKQVCDSLEKFNKDKVIIPITSIRIEELTEDSVDLLKKAGFRWVEVGLQSTNKVALSNVGRTFNEKLFLRGVKLLKEANIQIHTDIIIGLPGDNFDGFTNTLDFVKKCGLESGVCWFVLSVLPNTVLRKEANKYGLEFQQLPPYRLKSSFGFSPGEIQKAKHSSFRFGIHNFFEGTMVSYYTGDYPIATKKVAGDKKSINKIILQLDNFDPSSAKLVEVAQQNCRIINSPLTIWIRYQDENFPYHMAERFMRIIKKSNPYIYWNIILETKYEIDLRVVKWFNTVLLNSRVFVNEYDKTNVRIFFLFPFKDSFVSEKYLEEVKKRVRFFWMYEVIEEDFSLKELRQLFGTEADGYVVDFHPKCESGFVKHIYKILNHDFGRKNIYFKNIVLERRLTSFENILIVNGEEERRLPFSDLRNKLKLQMFSWQLALKVTNSPQESRTKRSISTS